MRLLLTAMGLPAAGNGYVQIAMRKLWREVQTESRRRDRFTIRMNREGITEVGVRCSRANTEPRRKEHAVRRSHTAG